VVWRRVSPFSPYPSDYTFTPSRSTHAASATYVCYGTIDGETADALDRRDQLRLIGGVRSADHLARGWLRLYWCVINITSWCSRVDPNHYELFAHKALNLERRA
jgi:hypothetical protein